MVNFKPRLSVVPPASVTLSADDALNGSDKTERIIAVELDGNDDVFFIERNGVIIQERRPHTFWFVSPTKKDITYQQLEGGLHYSYIYKTTTKAAIEAERRSNPNTWNVWDAAEETMVLNGSSLFKGMELFDLSVLSIDIESYGLLQMKRKEIYVISCTLWKDGKITRKQFCEDEFKTQKELIESWCEWVREVDPTVITGWNVLGYDLPYIHAVAKKCKAKIELGRDGSSMYVPKRDSNFPVDGSQNWTFLDIRIFGRHIVDSMFAAVRYDIGKKFPNWKLKSVMNVLHEEVLKDKENGKALGPAEQRILEVMAVREFYDAATIRDNWHDPVEREKIKRYCLHDGDDALNFFHIAMPAYFKLCQTIPRRLSELVNRRTGGAINLMFVRAYLQAGHSLPKASDVYPYQGAISEGYAGIYKEVIKWDVASLYPSIMLLHKVAPTGKDPLNAFQKILNHLTTERLKNKHLAATTGDAAYQDLSDAQKIVINSFYGFLGTKGLLFNSPDKAEFITEKGRDILVEGLEWAKSKGYTLVNCDTDSFSFTVGRPVGDEEQKEMLKEFNQLYDDQIKWEDDGYFKGVIVAKAKNYILYDGKKIKVKGAALKAPSKEPAIREMMKRMFDSFLGITDEVPSDIYIEYVKEAMKVTDITRWASKKSITESVLNPKRTQEQRVLDAIGKTPVQLGDKIYIFFETNEKICLTKDFNGCYDKDKLLGKLFNTVKIFKPFYAIENFTNYTLKKNKQELDKISGRVRVIKK